MNRIRHVRLYRYSIACTLFRKVGPLRKGLLIQLISDTGREGWGEIAPLPEFSEETLWDAEISSVKTARTLRGTQIPETYVEASDRAESLSRFPSVRFGFSAALSKLAAREGNLGLAVYLNSRAAASIQINALLTGPSPSLMQTLQKLKVEGYKSYKMKVGAGSPEDDIASIRLVREAIGPDAGLRLDANRAWSYDDAVHILSSLEDATPEYVEEPLADVDRLKELTDRIGMPVAGDESVASALRLVDSTQPGRKIHEIVGRLQGIGIRYAVLKPMLLGSLSFVLRLSESLSEGNIVPVLSSSFETAVGLSALVSLAAAGPALQNHSAGFDTLRYMPSELTDHGAVFLQSEVDAVRADQYAVHTERLERVDF